MHYAIDAANRIVEKLEGEPSLVDMVSVLATGCSTLRRILKDLNSGGLLRREIEALEVKKEMNIKAAIVRHLAM